MKTFMVLEDVREKLGAEKFKEFMEVSGDQFGPILTEMKRLDQEYPERLNGLDIGGRNKIWASDEKIEIPNMEIGEYYFEGGLVNLPVVINDDYIENNWTSNKENIKEAIKNINGNYILRDEDDDEAMIETELEFLKKTKRENLEEK